MSEPPPRPTSAAVAAALVRASESECMLADRPVEPGWWGLQTVDLQSGWQLVVWWTAEGLGPLHQAISPGGLEWSYGCARWPDWLSGPDSEPLDPIRHLLTVEQQEQLRERLLAVPCWPEREPPTSSVLPVLAFDDEMLSS